MPCSIGGRRVATSAPLFVIAEIGLNHGGRLEVALDLIDAAARAGASAVKVQALVADDLVAASCPPPAHVSASSLRDVFRQYELPLGAYEVLARRAHARGLAFVATPLSPAAIAVLEDARVDAYKIASGDVTYAGLLADVARTGKPVVLSTGMATLADVDRAVRLVREAGTTDLAVLHCVSAYPVPEGHENLRAISTLRRAFPVPVGLSDHGADTSAVPVAVALGACLYERHLMLEGFDSVDRAVSSSPQELAAVVRAAARVQAMLGHGRKECLPAEAPNLTASRRSLHSARALRAGHVVTADDITVLRPATGLTPAAFPSLVGAVLERDVEAGAPFLPIDLATERSARDAA